MRDLKGMQFPDVGGDDMSPDKQIAAATRSNAALLRSVFRPKDGEHIALIEGTNVIQQGNHRANELLRRAASSYSTRPDRITYDTPIYIGNFSRQ